MKYISLSLLSAILLVVLANLLIGLGIFGGKKDYEYLVLGPDQMDSVGYKAIAEEEGIAIDDEGKITFPEEIRPRLLKFNLLPTTLQSVQSEGDWQFVTVTADNFYIFRK